MSDDITDAQRSAIWAGLKAAGYSTHNVALMRRADSDIPHSIVDSPWLTKVWDWISSLSKEEASEVIEYLSDE